MRIMIMNGNDDDNNDVDNNDVDNDADNDDDNNNLIMMFHPYDKG